MTDAEELRACREAFEAWFRGRNQPAWDASLKGNAIARGIVAVAWDSWRAARSTPAQAVDGEAVAWGYVGARELGDLHSKGWAQVLRTPLPELGITTPVYTHLSRAKEAGEDANVQDAVVAAMLAYADRLDDALHTEDLRDVEASAQRLGLIAFKRSLAGELSDQRGEATCKDHLQVGAESGVSSHG